MDEKRKTIFDRVKEIKTAAKMEAFEEKLIHGFTRGELIRHLYKEVEKHAFPARYPIRQEVINEIIRELRDQGVRDISGLVLTGVTHSLISHEIVQMRVEIVHRNLVIVK